jgi:hypothetical protein
MANPEHLKILKQGVEVWNKWRKDNRKIKPDLSKADLKGAQLREANLDWAILWRADLRKANLSKASFFASELGDARLEKANLRKTNLEFAELVNTNLRKSDLSNAYLRLADLRATDLDKANLRGAQLLEARLNKANLRKADLREADLSKAILVGTKLNGARLADCRVYGISAWDVDLTDSEQKDLIITPRPPLPSHREGDTIVIDLNTDLWKEHSRKNAIRVDNLEIAQFVYMLLNNEKIRNVIDTIGENGVLILGRFTEERKVVLDAIRDKLREFGFVPMMFDFEKPTQRDFTETVKTLAGLSRFIIADITNPKSSPLELQATMPDYMIPFVPIIQENEEPFAMFRDLQQKYGDWVLDVLRYDSADNLLKVLDKAVVKPALKKADELLIKKAEGIRDRHVKDYM